MCFLGGRCLEGRYDVQRLLGQGQFAYVYLALDRSQNTHGSNEVALKLPKDDVQSRTSMRAELEFLETCVQKATECGAPDSFIGVLLLRRTIQLQRQFCYVFDTVTCDLLRIHEQNREGLPFEVVCNVGRDVARGLHFLHRSCGIIHMDIKLENIGVVDSLHSSAGCIGRSSVAVDLITNNAPSDMCASTFSGDAPPTFGGGSAPTLLRPSARLSSDSAPMFGASKGSGRSGSAHRGDLSPDQLGSSTTQFCLLDFGNATWVDPMKQTQVQQTVTYRSPEVVLRAGPLVAAADLWSLGCVLWELVCGFCFVELTREDLTSDGSRKQRVSHVSRMHSTLQEPFSGEMARAYSGLGGPLLPEYPAGSIEQRTLRLAHTLRRVRPHLPEVDAIADLLAPLLAINPHDRASAQLIAETMDAKVHRVSVEVDELLFAE